MDSVVKTEEPYVCHYADRKDCLDMRRLSLSTGKGIVDKHLADQYHEVCTVEGQTCLIRGELDIKTRDEEAGV